jgi:hypothetical protein
MNVRAHLVFAFYHLLTWYASPAIVSHYKPDAAKVPSYALGFLVSIVLYVRVGRRFIGEY